MWHIYQYVLILIDYYVAKVEHYLFKHNKHEEREEKEKI